MELNTPKIPDEFIETLPKGLKIIRKQNKDFLVVKEVCCPNGHTLMVNSVKIHGEPTIKIDVTVENHSGSVYIDAFWGSHAKLSSFLPVLESKDAVISAFCPICGINLGIESVCDQIGCGTKKHFLLNLPGKANRVLVCSRLGCPGHKIEIQDLPGDISEIVSEINYFGAQMEDIFKGI